MELYKYRNKYPQVNKNAYIQDGVKICGDVIIEEDVSIWFNTTIRGDINSITLKKGCNVQELSTIHVDFNHPTIIGEDTTIGHNCIIHGATIGNNVMIGMGAIVLNGANIPDGCLVGAGSLVTQNSTFEKDSLIIGSPAKAIRKVKDNEIDYIRRNAIEYINLSKEYKNEEEMDLH